MQSLLSYSMIHVINWIVKRDILLIIKFVGY